MDAASCVHSGSGLGAIKRLSRVAASFTSVSGADLVDFAMGEFAVHILHAPRRPCNAHTTPWYRGPR